MLRYSNVSLTISSACMVRAGIQIGGVTERWNICCVCGFCNVQHLLALENLAIIWLERYCLSILQSPVCLAIFNPYHRKLCIVGKGDAHGERSCSSPLNITPGYIENKDSSNDGYTFLFLRMLAVCAILLAYTILFYGS